MNDSPTSDEVMHYPYGYGQARGDRGTGFGMRANDGPFGTPGWDALNAMETPPNPLLPKWGDPRRTPGQPAVGGGPVGGGIAPPTPPGWDAATARPLDDINRFAAQARDQWRGEPLQHPLEAELTAAVEREARARFEAEEAAIRAELVDRARTAITEADGHYCDFGLSENDYTDFAEAAVDAFAEFYRERRG